MRFPIDWLGNYVALPKDTKELTEKLTMIGHLLDKIEVKNKNTVRLFTYVLSPFLLCLIGLLLLNTHVGPNLSVLN